MLITAQCNPVQKIQLGSKLPKGITAKRWKVKETPGSQPWEGTHARQQSSAFCYSQYKPLWRKNGQHHIVPQTETQMDLQSALNRAGFVQRKALGCITKATESSWVDRRKINAEKVINAIGKQKLSLPFWKGISEAISKCAPPPPISPFPKDHVELTPTLKLHRCCWISCTSHLNPRERCVCAGMKAVTDSRTARSDKTCRKFALMEIATQAFQHDSALQS